MKSWRFFSLSERGLIDSGSDICVTIVVSRRSRKRVDRVHNSLTLLLDTAVINFSHDVTDMFVCRSYTVLYLNQYFNFCLVFHQFKKNGKPDFFRTFKSKAWGIVVTNVADAVNCHVV